jgi:hypothetical protein
MYNYKIKFLALFTFAFLFAQSQIKKVDSLLVHNNFFHNQQASLSLLSGWSVANLALSPYSSKNLFQPIEKNDYFQQMNFMFNVVNGAIAGFAHYEVYRRSKLSWSLSEIEQQRKKARTSIKINMGLDLSYILSGILLNNISPKNPNDINQFKGYGSSLIFQGAYLLIYDAIFLRKIRN